MKFSLLKGFTTLVTSKEGRHTVKKVVLIILSPLLLFILAITATADAGTQHNQEVLDTLFEYKAIPQTAPLEFKEYMETMQHYFRKIDKQVEQKQSQVKEGVLDAIQIKSLFLSIYVQETAPDLSDSQIEEYTLCFTSTVVSDDTQQVESNVDKEAKKEDIKKGEVSKTLVVLNNMEQIKKKVQDKMNITITEDMMRNYQSIVSYVNPGMNASTQGDGVALSEQFVPLIEKSKKKKYVGGGMGSPFMDDWQSKVTSEFGYRDEITLPDGTVTSSAHTGLDMGAPAGTPILALNDGEIVYVRNHQVGLGLHLVVDHGGGKLSVYGHTSRIIVKEGDKVKKGQKIAEVGMTGYSTGNHLHLEIWEDGKAQNPRNYLEK